MVTDADLLKFQEQVYMKHRIKTDVYHSEENRVVAAFPIGQPPTPFNVLEVVRY